MEVCQQDVFLKLLQCGKLDSVCFDDAPSSLSLDTQVVVKTHVGYDAPEKISPFEWMHDCDFTKRTWHWEKEDRHACAHDVIDIRV